MQLAVLTPEHEFVGEIDIVNQLFANELNKLHIRKSRFTSGDYSDYIRQINPEYRNRVVIHGAFELVDELGLAGIHLSSYARIDAGVLKQAEAIPSERRSTSFHSWAEIEENAYPYGYVFISPVFDSISKPGYHAAIDLSKVGEVRAHCQAVHGYCPGIYGLGGVEAGAVATLAKNGFDGATVLGGVWESSDPVAAFIAIRNAII